MLDLNTNLTLKTIQKSKALQEIKCDKYCSKISGEVKTFDEWMDKWMETEKNTILSKLYPALTIADVISNAESLFGNKILDLCYLCKKPAKFKKAKNYHSSSDCCGFDMERKFNFNYIQDEILKMCQQGKPLTDIEKIILNNIKD